MLGYMMNDTSVEWYSLAQSQLELCSASYDPIKWLENMTQSNFRLDITPWLLVLVYMYVLGGDH